ncbi:protein transport to vacuole protein [Malassezia pachydermatis]|uniref:BRO domain-containing protein 1 n=1 Tax=Malassezia pachydermatis TaxID=77020 RepID=A0A0M8MRL2_9BASI|nr:bro1-domain-containing protein [Malassezia pachydermatis]KOS15367.1 bro1-domain-containing protein [Malassezia pachydermatis]
MQSPLLVLPVKDTRDVDLTKPLSALIRTSYEQNPATYAEELARIQQAREDAVSDKNSDTNSRDMLFRYFHMVEMLELRFPDMKATFVWFDAFTHTEVTQQTWAYEKACIIFNTAARVACIASQQNRHDSSADALKRAYAGYRQAAGLLDYIKDNFLYAPSDDLKGPTLQSLRTLMLVQAAEIFLEKTIHDGKGDALIAKLASHVAATYGALAIEWADETCTWRTPIMWGQLVRCKAEYFTAMTQYHRAKADNAAGQHASALARFRLADAKARSAASMTSFETWMVAAHLRETLTSEATSMMRNLTQAQCTATAEALREAERDNDLVYHERAPAAESLAPIDQTSVATPIAIRELFSHPDVQKMLGADILQGLVPLSVLESASMYSEEQAKLVRAEAAKLQDGEDAMLRALSTLQLPECLDRYAGLEGHHPPPTCVPSHRISDLASDLQVGDVCTRMDREVAALSRPVDKVREALECARSLLDIDARECEHARVQFGAQYTQLPTASAGRTLRRDIQAAQDALASAQDKDQAIQHLWQQVQSDVALLSRGPNAVQTAYKEAVQARASQSQQTLIDADVADAAPARALLQQIRTDVKALQHMPSEREAMLQELKQQVRQDDISRTLLLNRRVKNIEPTLFAQELNKYAPLRQRMDDHLALQQKRIEALTDALDRLSMHPGAADVRRTWDATHSTAQEWDARLLRAYDAYVEVQSGMYQAQNFYTSAAHTSEQLSHQAETFLAERRAERAPWRSTSMTTSYTPSSTSSTTLAEDLAALHMGSRAHSTSSAPTPPSWPAPSNTYAPRFASSSSSQPAPPPRPPRV